MHLIVPLHSLLIVVSFAFIKRPPSSFSHASFPGPTRRLPRESFASKKSHGFIWQSSSVLCKQKPETSRTRHGLSTASHYLASAVFRPPLEATIVRGKLREEKTTLSTLDSTNRWIFNLYRATVLRKTADSATNGFPRSNIAITKRKPVAERAFLFRTCSTFLH